MNSDMSKCQAVLDRMPGAVLQCLYDPHLTMEAVNQGFLDLFGFTREELNQQFGTGFLQMIHPEDRADVRKKLQTELEHREGFSLSYRVACKDAGYRWVLGSGRRAVGEDGSVHLDCVMLDNTQTKDTREELRLSLERQKIIMDQSTDIIFEWDMVSDTLDCSPNWTKKFGYLPMRSRVTERMPISLHIHPDDMERMVELMDKARAGEPYFTTELRIMDSAGVYFWCRIRVTDQYDEAGKPIKAVGMVTDIDQDKKMIEDLRRRAERDAMTGLYNREAMTYHVKQHLEANPGECCALFMVDVDNFKQINDTKGHLFGDAVLSDLAAGMKKLTRSSDVIGRIGGDEFALFLKHISQQSAEAKAAQILQMFQTQFQFEKQAFAVSCSIGISMYPDDGEDFLSLYHSADQALYQAKKRGKNQFAMFDRDHAVSVEETSYTSLGAAIDSDIHAPGVSGDLVNYVFRVLYDSTDVDHAIRMILEIVGKRFDVSRVYIFENTQDGAYCNNTYEWCNEGIHPEKENLQHVCYAELDHFDKLFEDNSIFYCRDIRALAPSQAAFLEQQGIYSTLQCAIRAEKEFWGFVGFDECTGMRIWTKEEVGTLSLVAQLVSTFLQKKRATDRDRQLVGQLKTILDVQDAYIYVIDRISYELLYINHKTAQLDGGAKLGMTCYHAFFGNIAPCDNCPLQDGLTNEIYNPKYNIWTRVNIVAMNWNDRDAFLLSCYDITAYKQLQEPLETSEGERV